MSRVSFISETEFSRTPRGREQPRFLFFISRQVFRWQARARIVAKNIFLGCYPRRLPFRNHAPVNYNFSIGRCCLALLPVLTTISPSALFDLKPYSEEKEWLCHFQSLIRVGH